MCFTTISQKRYMTIEFYIKEPMQTIEMRMKKEIDNYPHIKSELERGTSHLLIIKKLL